MEGIWKEESFFRGYYFRETAITDSRIDQGVYQLSEEVWPWKKASTLTRMIFTHHRCTTSGTVKRICHHERCPTSCSYATSILTHSDTREYFLEKNFRVLA
jgi:hypothetical protein